MLHKTLAITALTVATLAGTVSPATAGGGVGADTLPAFAPNRLVITVTGTGDADGTYVLVCDPDGGRHPEPEAACDAVQNAQQALAPTSSDALCTYLYGGPATAEVEGTWQGEPVSAHFDRSNGCEIARWDSLVPALPRIGGDQA
ncbi:SSI family serine proteinase inhibitor [Streptomyces sp. B6B3]|uniref:SSI family serine proteinase inhibitor n=1 Tax=Streptomyces sp. B6B3 TaxID=3153570 RepID=UPI00325C4556